MSEAVFYNTLAWAFEKTPSNDNSKNAGEYRGSVRMKRIDNPVSAVLYLRTWFLDEATRMNPHLDYAQLRRGPGEQRGSQTGVLCVQALMPSCVNFSDTCSAFQ